jgi:hypothetical protein
MDEMADAGCARRTDLGSEKSGVSREGECQSSASPWSSGSTSVSAIRSRRWSAILSAPSLPWSWSTCSISPDSFSSFVAAVHDGFGLGVIAHRRDATRSSCAEPRILFEPSTRLEDVAAHCPIDGRSPGHGATWTDLVDRPVNSGPSIPTYPFLKTVRARRLIRDRSRSPNRSFSDVLNWTRWCASDPGEWCSRISCPNSM